MSYDTKKKQSMGNLKPHKWQLLCFITRGIELHNSPLRPAAPGRDFEHCLLYVMEIEQNEVDKE